MAAKAVSGALPSPERSCQEPLVVVRLPRRPTTSGRHIDSLARIRNRAPDFPRPPSSSSGRRPSERRGPLGGFHRAGRGSAPINPALAPRAGPWDQSGAGLFTWTSRNRAPLGRGRRRNARAGRQLAPLTLRGAGGQRTVGRRAPADRLGASRRSLRAGYANRAPRNSSHGLGDQRQQQQQQQRRRQQQWVPSAPACWLTDLLNEFAKLYCLTARRDGDGPPLVVDVCGRPSRRRPPCWLGRAWRLEGWICSGWPAA